MVAVFAVFATLRTLDVKQMGVGLAVAVFLDATIVRAVLLPAGMKLLGDRNWYLPSWLEWLPSLSAGRPARPGRSAEELDLAGVDRPAVHEQAALPVEPAAHAFEAVDRDPATT
jgi:RND superfamily putative drug exporter